MTQQYFLLKGQDKLMNTSLEQRISNTCSCCIMVNEENSSDTINETIVKRIKRALRDEKHYLRARQNLDNLDYYYYTQENPDRLAKKIVRKSDKYLTHIDLGKILVKSGFSAIIVVYKNSFFIAATHLFVEGLKFSDLIGLCLDKQIVDYDIIPKFKYIPGLIEASVIPGIIGSVMSLSERKLSVDRKWNEKLYPIQQKFYSNKLSDVRKFKEYLNRKFNKFSYSATLAVISGIYTFENIIKDEINIGIVAAFINNARFNNFSSVIIALKRPTNWKNNSLLENAMDIAYQIDYAVKSYGKSSLVINYLATNVYNFNIYATSHIDVIVSCAPTSKPCVFNGKDADINIVEMFGTTPPLYLGFWTSNEDVKLSASTRSNDIDLNKMDSLQIEEVIGEID